MQLEIKLKNFYFFILILLISFNLNSTNSNSFGITGSINTPNAYSMKESSLRADYFYSYPEKKLNLTASPFEWMEATIFYSSIENKPYLAYGGNGYIFENQSYKDKGFNVKAILKQEGDFPAIAVGLNDFAGTGLYDSEYIVLSKSFNNFIISAGIGWGNYSQGISVSNPLTFISNRFEDRPGDYEVGNFNIDRYFSGDASIFGSLSYKLNNKFIIDLEYDPTDTDNFIEFKEPSTNINFGVTYNYDDWKFKTNFIRGQELGFQISYSQNFLNFNKDKKFKRPKKTSENKYIYLQEILKLNNIGLKEIAEEDDFTSIKVRHNQLNSVEAIENIVSAYRIVEPNISGKDLYLEHQTLGMTMNKNLIEKQKSYSPKNLKTFDKNQKAQIDYKVTDKFPYFNQSFALVPRFFLASREGFFFQGLIAEYNSEVILKDNLLILTNLKRSLYDNFDGLYIPPVDTYPNQVRSDVKEYIKNFDRGIAVGRLEVNYFKEYKSKHYMRFTGGIFEEMFGGVGFEYLYYPSNSLFSFGYENFYVKKRDYSMRFKFKEYKNYLQRISAQAYDPKTRIIFNLSYGEYLAGDIGSTINVKRRFQNGVEFGFFFSDTDVSKEQYGEGSFDKGIMLKVPFSVFGGKSSLQKWEWRPLTKDPAAQLIKSIDLREYLDKNRIY